MDSKNRQLTIIMILAVLSLGFSSDFSAWHKSGQGIYESEIREILVDPSDDNRIYAGTGNALYRSIDRGAHYKVILRLSGESKSINDIFISQDDPQLIYAATDNGLYGSMNAGKTWEKIYASSDVESAKCHSVIYDDGRIYVGTQKGLFYKKADETRWNQIKEKFRDRTVYYITHDNDFIYFALSNSVIAMEKQAGELSEVFSSGIVKREDEYEDEPYDESNDKAIRSLVASSLPYPYVFIASAQGIYMSDNNGKDWRRVARDTFVPLDINVFLVIEDSAPDPELCRQDALHCFKFIVGTTKGAFFLEKGKWKPVYRGMETNVINGLAKDARNTVYAATDKGVFYLPAEKALPSYDSGRPESDVEPGEWLKFEHEPGINEVHQMAIDYAEVNYEKIQTWRRQARLRAWLPDLDIGVDAQRDWSSSDSIWGSYSSGGQHYVGPDDKTRGEDIGWDVSMSWDLSDLIWSTDQTTIDSRSKMMVELREDILNEITRLYFERRRNQIELVSFSYDDWRQKADKEMRIAELTALIDALTGGKFSRSIENNNSKLP